MNKVSRSDIFTRRDIADYMISETLEAQRNRDISELKILEPCCGKGAFVFPLLERLADDIRKGLCTWDDIKINHFLTAIDINSDYIAWLKDEVLDFIVGESCKKERAKCLVDNWFVAHDFLKYDSTLQYDIVIGNPPYIRYDNLPYELQAYYAERYSTFSGRSDIYVPFFEHALGMLSTEGCLCYICTNRFTKCGYGKRLRNLISKKYHVRLYLNMEHTQPFDTDVSAYPAIFLIDRDAKAPTFAATVDNLSGNALERVRIGSHGQDSMLERFDRWFIDGLPWMSTSLSSKVELDALSIFPTIGELDEDMRLGIGIATGADDVFVHRGKPENISDEHLLPLAVSHDLKTGTVHWSGHYLISPYDPNTNKLYGLDNKNDLKNYFEKNKAVLSKRHCAKKDETQWYRTIDRVSYPLLYKKKLLIPDIQMGGCVAFDEMGRYYPHHNVYWITSDRWNLFALCVILRSEFVTSQIRMLSPQLRGGSLRYQAQVLRKIRMPYYAQFSNDQIQTLAMLYHETNQSAINHAVNTIIDAIRSHRQVNRIVPKQLDLFMG